MTAIFKAICQSEKPPLLLFDLGNILVRLNSVDLLWPNQQPEPGTLPFSVRWGMSKAVIDYESGRINDLDSFYQAAKAELGFSVPEKHFVRVFLQVIGELFDETIPLLTALKKCFPLMLLSNTSKEHWLHCRDQLGLGGFFEQEFLSYEMGIMKPDPKIFRDVLERVPYEPRNIWYFDDKAENTAEAQKLGMHALTCWGGKPLIDQLCNLGMLEVTGRN